MQKKRLASFRKAIQEVNETGLPDSGFRPTHDDIEAWYRFFNRYIFDNALSPLAKPGSRPKAYLLDLSVRGGICWGKTILGFGKSGKWMYWLELNKKFPSKRFFLNILAHEMIHLYQIEHESPQFDTKTKHPKAWGHGKSFKKWRPKFLELGLEFRAHFEYIDPNTY